MHHRTLLLLPMLLAAAACTREVAIQSPQGQPLGSAIVVWMEEGRGLITLHKDGAQFDGSWTSARVDESGAIAARHGLGSRHYQNYQRGWTIPLYQGQARLQSAAAGSLDCSFRYRGSRGYGHCQNGQGDFDFVVAG